MGRWLSATPFWTWLIVAAIGGGVLGLGGYTFLYADGASYLSDDPAACANCHVMREVYDGWHKGTHTTVAVCNDCHTPHRFPDKYIVKGLNGWNHSVAFTGGNFHEPIQITGLNGAVAQENCLHCHGDLVVAISHEGDDDATDCLRCHEGVGHSK